MEYNIAPGYFGSTNFVLRIGGIDRPYYTFPDCVEGYPKDNDVYTEVGEHNVLMVPEDAPVTLTLSVHDYTAKTSTDFLLRGHFEQVGSASPIYTVDAIEKLAGFNMNDEH